MITVVAALIQQNGRLLICQRRRSDSLPLKWEFPGGKVRRGESPADALARELAEELGMEGSAVAIGPELYRTRHRYAEHTDDLELIFYSAALPREPEWQPRNLAFEQHPRSCRTSISFLPTGNWSPCFRAGRCACPAPARSNVTTP